MSEAQKDMQTEGTNLGLNQHSKSLENFVPSTVLDSCATTADKTHKSSWVPTGLISTQMVTEDLQGGLLAQRESGDRKELS